MCMYNLHFDFLTQISRVRNCWQWVKFTMESNEQNQHFAELRQKVCLYIHVVVLQRGLPSLDRNSNVLSQKKAVAKLESGRL